MMFGIASQKLRSTFWLGAVLAMASALLLPLQPATAQTRVLPDFTDLVEQVGPSVVNIRTIEKVMVRPSSGSGMDEDMLEFFRRFGLPMPNVPRQQGPRSNRPQEEEQPRGVGS
ncbi:MAG: serine peptidase, partial [Pseudomonadota bacterium]|nr:serine peptidase [Pseudomonadota bacterium]